MAFIIKPLITEKMNNITEKTSVDRTFKAKTGAHKGGDGDQEGSGQVWFHRKARG